MKKIFVLLILSMLSTSLFAQTQKLHVFGFTLGHTESKTVEDYFEKEGVYYKKERADGCLGIFEVNNASFIGFTWDLARFDCVSNYCYLNRVEFIRVIPAASRKMVSSEIRVISKEIKERYGNSIKLADHSPWDSSKNNDDIIWKTYDGSNWILIKYFYTGKGDDYSISLTFIYNSSYRKDYKEDVEKEESSENDSGDVSDDTSTSAEPEKEILGFTLGKTTIEEVKNYYERNGHQYTVKDGLFSEYIEVNDIDYYGFSWHYVDFYFYGNKLRTIKFLDTPQYSKESPELAINKLQSINKKILEKHGKTLEEKDGLPWELGAGPNETVWKMNNGSTWIGTDSYLDDGVRMIQMAFYDNELNMKEEESIILFYGDDFEY